MDREAATEAARVVPVRRRKNVMKGDNAMSKRTWLGVASVLAATVIGVSGALAAEKKFDTDPKHQLPKPDAKAADMTKPVKVFVLMGQSNMVGMGEVGPETTKGTLGYLTKAEKRYPYLLDEAGNWSKRNDVRYAFVMQGRGGMQINYNDWLTIKGGPIGPEVAFGHVMGQVFDEPVLILKACIGNRSLGWDLLPPGSERYEVNGKIYAGYKDSPDSWPKGTEPKPIGWYAGKQYDDDVANAKKVLSELGKYYPGAEKYEVAGFVWWQGHKDQNPVHASRYEQNLVNLIKCLRKDFNAPNAPFVLAVGCGNPGRTSFGLQIAEAQLAMNDAKKHPEFAGNVKCVESRDFWREADVSPKNQGYHYNRNAETYMEVGNALGWAMAELLQK
jgi:alpha-galactosidase